MLDRLVVALVSAGLLVEVATSGAWAQLDKLANTTPQERARLQTDFMKNRLRLTPEQTSAVSALNLKYAQQAQPIIQSSEGAFIKMRQLRGLDEAKEGELRGILSPQQFEQRLEEKAGAGK